MLEPMSRFRLERRNSLRAPTVMCQLSAGSIVEKRHQRMNILLEDDTPLDVLPQAKLPRVPETPTFPAEPDVFRPPPRVRTRLLKSRAPRYSTICSSSALPCTTSFPGAAGRPKSSRRRQGRPHRQRPLPPSPPRTATPTPTIGHLRARTFVDQTCVGDHGVGRCAAAAAAVGHAGAAACQEETALDRYQ